MQKTNLQTVDLKKNAAGETITAVELARLQAVANEVEDLRKAAQKATDLETELATFKKNSETETAKLNSQLAEFNKAKDDADQLQMVTFTKGLTFLAEEDRETLGVTLFKASRKDSEGVLAIVASLNKAQDTISEFATKETGTDATAEEDLNKASGNDELTDGLALMLKSRKTK